jgi:prolyl-tRNA editing enzyme YbaK/EbsC (Cys-tRNA(Pro) deacylase)
MTDDLPRAAAAVVAAGRSLGLELDVREFPEGTRTAADAARAIGCHVDQIVKSLVFLADTEPVLVLTSGGNRVDVVKVGKRRDAAAVRKADAEEVRAATGYAIGGTPPFGHARDLPVLVDRHLTSFREVWAAAGTPRHVFPITPEDLLRATGGQVTDVTLVEDGPPAGS